MDRRDFIRKIGIMTMLNNRMDVFATADAKGLLTNRTADRMIRIKCVESDFEREPLACPFGFKGGYITELWQSVIRLESETGIHKIGLGTNSVLWSDSSVFTAHSESAGNALMYAVTDYALQILEGQTFTFPIQLIDDMLDEVMAYGRMVTSNSNLRKTFALNALVGIDNALWLLYAAENGLRNFDDMIPEAYRPALSYKHNRIASIPLFSYNSSLTSLSQITDEGQFFIKIKLGQPGTQEEMLEKDMERLSLIHNTIGHVRTPYTKNGKLLYYFDANGRYEKKETLERFVNYARKVGAYDQIALIEEPFPEDMEIDVSDLDVRLVADESAHTDYDTLVRIQMGYKAIALKAIAKTMSMTMKIAKVAHENAIPCFCADLTVNPVLVEWNKNIAARLAPFPGLDVGLLETNGSQNYKNWNTMLSYNQSTGKKWCHANKGLFYLDEEYYRVGGGIFDESPHYEDFFAHSK